MSAEVSLDGDCRLAAARGVPACNLVFHHAPTQPSPLPYKRQEHAMSSLFVVCNFGLVFQALFNWSLSQRFRISGA